MKSVFLLSIFILAFLCFDVKSANKNLPKSLPKDSILLIIDGKQVTIEEFERIYKKNNNKETGVDTKSLEEYLDLFINFKLKVLEAEKNGLDTTKAFKTELAGYRKQLAKPYLVDKDIDEGLMKEAYGRMQYDVSASHILVKLDANALPKDTLDAWNKIMKARKRIQDGEQFSVVAKEVSEDPSVKDNNGSLGWFTAFQMVYPFESAVYNTKPGELSMPFRSAFGYHIVIVHDKRKASGEIKVAHIMVLQPKTAGPEDEANAKKKIFEIYEKLKVEKDFAKVARENSEDKGTASRGGDLPWFGTGKMVPEFEQAAFQLKANGDFSEPVKTAYGWHIIKRVDKRDIGAYEDLKSDIKNKISKDERAERSKQAVVAKLKNYYNFKEFTEADNDAANKKGKTKKNNTKVSPKKNLDDFYLLVTDSIFEGKWNVKEALLTKKLFQVGDSVYTQGDFAKQLMKFNKKSPKTGIVEFVNNKYKDFVETKIIKYEEDRLEAKYPEFRYLMNEYHDGILLFELTDKTVWSKAIKDTVGLKDYYENNKSKYMWDIRYDMKLYSCKNEKACGKALDMFINNKKNMSADDILKSINKKDTLVKIVEKGIFLKGDNKTVDIHVTELKDKSYLVSKEGVDKFSEIKKLEPAPKSLEEAKGLITADYQTYLEDKWIKDLRSKYKIQIFRDALKLIK